MRARFYSDTCLENFVDEAFEIHDVEVESNPFNRDVTIKNEGALETEMRALVQINSGEVIEDEE